MQPKLYLQKNGHPSLCCSCCLLAGLVVCCCVCCAIPCRAELCHVWTWWDAWPSAGRGSHRWFFPCHCPFCASTQSSVWDGRVGRWRRQGKRTYANSKTASHATNMQSRIKPPFSTPPTHGTGPSFLHFACPTDFVSTFLWLSGII